MDTEGSPMLQSIQQMDQDVLEEQEGLTQSNPSAEQAPCRHPQLGSTRTTAVSVLPKPQQKRKLLLLFLCVSTAQLAVPRPV